MERENINSNSKKIKYKSGYSLAQYEIEEQKDTLMSVQTNISQNEKNTWSDNFLKKDGFTYIKNLFMEYPI